MEYFPCFFFSFYFYPCQPFKMSQGKIKDSTSLGKTTRIYRFFLNNQTCNPNIAVELGEVLYMAMTHIMDTL